MTRKIVAVAVAVVLFALPFAGRWLYYYQGRYRPAAVPRPDLKNVAPTIPDMPTFTDELGTAGPAGIVLVDRAHDNRFAMGELSVLRARLAARGQRLEAVADAEDLAADLRDAAALLIISPGSTWTADEINEVRAFVDKGGRLLLVGDPTRFGILTDESGQFLGLDSDVVHLNDLAAGYGLLFQPDYLYNTVEHEGNFRNIRLTEFDKSALTGGLKQVVFYAAHSIRSTDPALIAAGGDTRSSSTERAEELPVAVLAGGGSVLALGDLTFMSEPYNAVYDNDRLIANIADFLRGGQRRYDLADFPFFFGDEADLVYAGDPMLDSELLAGGSSLQELFRSHDRTLTVRDVADEGRDTLFFGLYRKAGEVAPYLAEAGVTLVITSTETQGEEEDERSATPQRGRGGSSPESDVAPGAAMTVTAEATGDRIEVESVGRLVLTGTAVLALQSEAERAVLVVLAATQAGLDNAVERLSGGDLSGCVLQVTEVPTPTTLALCPTGEVSTGEGKGGWEPSKPGVEPPDIEPTPSITDTETPTGPVGSPEGRIVIVSLDAGEGRYDSLTGADEFAAALEGYDVTVWSKAGDGTPSVADLMDYDLVIWATGDFEGALGDEEQAAIGMLTLQGTPMLFSGAYLGDADTQAVQRDVEVVDAEHPVMAGFTAGQEIDFDLPPSGSEYEIDVLTESNSEQTTVLLARGPDSEPAGAPSVLALEEESTGMRLVYVGLPIYLLPETDRTQLVLNAVTWLLAP